MTNEAEQAYLPEGLRPAWAEVDLRAITHNARLLKQAAGDAALCAVVKANGYGHGAPEVARAAHIGGAEWLGVALVDEGVRLRVAGLEAPILILSQPPDELMGRVVKHHLTPTIYTVGGLRALAREAAGAGRGPVEFHLKVDTGMHRIGAQPGEIPELIEQIDRLPEVRLSGIFTHFAVADEPDNPYTATQLTRFASVLEQLGPRRVSGLVAHAANSAGALLVPHSRMDLVRAGIALYGLAPGEHPACGEAMADFRPAMSLKAKVSYVKTLTAGEAVSYGLRYQMERDSVVATVPLGYADGVPRDLGLRGGEVLIGGRPRPIAGTVTMDQLMVDCGPTSTVKAGDEVVLIGRQGGAEISAWDWARVHGTIAYEIVCGISGRIPRVYL